MLLLEKTFSSEIKADAPLQLLGDNTKRNARGGSS